jgi:membrane fusion protein (multidrug efflux system)
MRHRDGICAVAFATATAAALIAGCKGKAEQAAAPPPPDVIVAEVVQKDVPIYVEWVGTIDGNINAQIRARVNGYLQSRDYTEGTFVHANDLLFMIDPRPYEQALAAAKGDLARTDALATKTQQDVTRYTPLARSGAISRQELDNAIQANRAALAASDSARAAVEKAQLDLDWTQVKSPIDGVAGISDAQVGDLISENSVLTTVSQIDPVRVSFPISEQEYLRYADRIQLKPDPQRQQQSNFELVLADGNAYAHRGSATIANRQVDVKTGTMMIVANFPNPDNLLRPGQYGKVRATTETKKGALLVPQRAVQEVQGAYQVAAVGADNTVTMRTVTAGARVGNMWVIDSGLKPGERVVVEGLQKVRNGMTVAPKTAEAAAAETKAAESGQAGAKSSAETAHK